MKPFLKYPGNKYSSGEIIYNYMKSWGINSSSCFVELFGGVGGLSHYLHDIFDCDKYQLNDISKPLTLTMKTVKCGDLDRLFSFLTYLWQYRDKEAYLNAREYFNRYVNLPGAIEAEKYSAYFIYLNKLGFRGLVRLNSKGEYNTSYGDYVDPYLPSDEIQWFGQSKIEVFQRDYRETLHLLEYSKDTVIYVDPPYIPVSKTANFTSYTNTSWSLEDHVDLLDHLCQVKEKGYRIIYSNYNTQDTRNLLSSYGLEYETYSSRRGLRLATDQQARNEVICLIQ